MRAFIALPILAALSFASTALADPPANTIMKATPPEEKQAPVDPAVMCVHRFQMQAAQLTQLGARLKLTDAQKPVFAAWRKTRLDLFQGVPCPEPSTGFEVSAPKRVENQIAVMAAMLDGLRKELPATEALYNALTPEQRAVFDGPIRVATVPPPANDKPQPAH
jgi:Spy/CpxP family protein refolding chaperone